MLKSLIGLISIILITGCFSPVPNRNPLGEAFPSVQGTTLSDETRTVPEDFAGESVILLLGYVQNSQFDIDRWLIGLDQTGVTTTAYELPTIKGLIPRFFQTTIDDGMRSGIPKELWGGVITVYADGDLVQAFTGSESPNNARVMVLDPTGKVIYFHDRGFSVGALNALRATLQTQAVPTITSD